MNCFLLQRQDPSQDSSVGSILAWYQRGPENFSMDTFKYINHASEHQVNSHSNLNINTLPCWDLNPGPAMDPSMKKMAHKCATVL